jgi:hypothetical protein
VRDRGHHPLTTGTTPPQARHLGIDAGLIKEDNIANPSRMRQQPSLTLAPDRTRRLDIRALLLTGVRGIFFQLIFFARNQSSRVETGARTPWTSPR